MVPWELTRHNQFIIVFVLRAVRSCLLAIYHRPSHPLHHHFQMLPLAVIEVPGRQEKYFGHVLYTGCNVTLEQD